MEAFHPAVDMMDICDGTLSCPARMGEVPGFGSIHRPELPFS